FSDFVHARRFGKGMAVNRSTRTCRVRAFLVSSGRSLHATLAVAYFHYLLHVRRTPRTHAFVGQWLGSCTFFEQIDDRIDGVLERAIGSISANLSEFRVQSC